MLSCEETQAWLDHYHNIANGILPQPPVKRLIRDEVVVHNRHDDIWVIVNGKVIDLTSFFVRIQGLISPVSLKISMVRIELALKSVFQKPLQELLAYAGKDLSHFFDAHGRPLTRISVEGNIQPRLVATLEPTKCTEEACELLNWWNEPHYVIGEITQQERRLCIVNTLTSNIIILLSILMVK